MNVTKNTPVPVDPPPTTFDLTGLTEQELDDIRLAVFNRACNDKGEVNKARFRKLHGDIYEGQVGSPYLHPYDNPATVYTPWP